MQKLTFKLQTLDMRLDMPSAGDIKFASLRSRNFGLANDLHAKACLSMKGQPCLLAVLCPCWLAMHLQNLHSALHANQHHVMCSVVAGRRTNVGITYIVFFHNSKLCTCQ